MDAVEAAKSGHPGMPMGMAEIAVALWTRHLRHNPAESALARSRPLRAVERSRLDAAVRAAASDRLRPADRRSSSSFRQLHSKTPGHPEVGLTPGVETTTGPLGQGLANAVGMALAEKLLAARVQPAGPRDRRPSHVRVRRRRLPDGRHLARSVLARRHAGPRQADRVLRRQRHLDRRRDARLVHRRHAASASRPTAGTSSPTSTATTSPRSTPRFARAQAVADTPDADLLQDDHRQRRADQGRHRGRARRGARRQGSRGDARSARLDARRRSRFPRTSMPAWSARDAARARRATGTSASPRTAPRIRELAAEFERRIDGELPADFAATRRARSSTRRPRRPRRRDAQGVAAGDRGLRGDAAGNDRRLGRPHRLGVHQLVRAARTVARDQRGNYVNFGVREFAWPRSPTALALHGGFIPYVGTFLTFSDYTRNALRMAALMKLRAIFVFTHDSIGLGEDGPTHQSIEHAASLRLIPQLDVWRPCDTVETAVAWAAAIERADGPTALLFTRQNVPFVPRDAGGDRSDPPRRLRARRFRRARRHRRASWSSRPARRSRSRSARAKRCAGRHRGARRLDAVHPGLRPAGRRVPRDRAAARRAARRRRSRRHRRLAQVRRRRRRSACRGRRARPLRRIGARRRAVQALRLHGRERRRRGARMSHRGDGVEPPVRLRRRIGDRVAVAVRRSVVPLFEQVRCARLVTRSDSDSSNIRIEHSQEKRHDHQSRDQRLRPHRPQHPARALRRRQEARPRDRRDQRPRQPGDQRAPDALRHRARQVPGQGRGRRRRDGRQRRPHQGVRRSAIRRSCRGARSASTSCSNARASSRPRKRPART